MQVERIHPAVDLLKRTLPGSADFPVQAAVVRGERHTVVVDTLCRPADMAPVAGATLVIYTHSDWDHCWGTTALPGLPVIAHRICRERLLSAEARDLLAKYRAQRPAEFEGAAIILPDITMDDRITIDAGGLTLCLEHLPGHTEDSLVIHIPELKMLLAGDAVEVPIPSLNETGGIAAWPGRLRRWLKEDLEVVVPSHGRPGGPELLEQNAAYLEALLERVGAGLRQGLSIEQIKEAIPYRELVPRAGGYPDYYEQGHLYNVAQVAAELKGAQRGGTPA